MKGAMAQSTLTDRWLRRMKNNPFVAGIIILGISLAAIFTFWNQLPRPLRDWVGDHFVSRNPSDALPDMGWVFAGYADNQNELRWASPARVRLVEQSGGAGRPHIFRTGDIVQPLEPVHQVIADYRTAGVLHQLDAPWTVTEEIRKREDWTGRVYDIDTRLEVLDVSVSQIPDHDWAVWIRVKPVGAAR
jgi:hypothetical protein